MQVLGYVRVSTEEQRDSGAGLTAQRAAITAEVERRGWTMAELVEDAGYSARSLKRPGISRAIDMLDTGQVDALLVAKLDRLSRSLLDFAGLMDRAQRKGWAIVALDLGVDTSTPAGEAMANVMATFAQFERRLIGQRTREALAVKRAQGVRLGRPTQLAGETRERIRDARERDGLTLAAIAAMLNDEGVPTAHGGRQWWPSSVRAALATA